MPTPPPWCTLTQVAPAAQLTSALRNTQSPMASVPSRIASVSRLGDATEPRVEVVAADDDGRLDLARAHQLVERQPRLVALAVAEPADARRQPLELHALVRPAAASAAECAFSREQLERWPGRCRRCRRDRPRAPPSGTAPCPRRRAGGCTRARSRGCPNPSHAGERRLAAQVVAVVEGVAAARFWRSIIARTCSAIERRASSTYFCGSRCAQLGSACGQLDAGRHVAAQADRAPRSDRSRDRARTPRRTSSGRTRARCPRAPTESARPSFLARSQRAQRVVEVARPCSSR